MKDVKSMASATIRPGRTLAQIEADEAELGQRRMQQATVLLGLIAVLLGAGIGAILWRSEADRAQLVALPAEKQALLLANYEDYQRMSAAERERLEALDRELDESPRRAELLAVLDRYHAWLEQLPEEERLKLLQMPSAERLARIRELRTPELAEARKQLSPDDLSRFFEWVMDQPRRPFGAPSLMMMFRGARSGSEPPPEMPAIDDEQLGRLRSRLSPAGVALLEEARTGGPQELRRLAWVWARQLQQRRPGPEVSQAELEQAFLKMSEEERKFLLSLSDEWIRIAIQFRMRGGGWPGGGTRPGEGPRDPDGGGGPRPPRGRGSNGRGGGPERPGGETGNGEPASPSPPEAPAGAP